MSFKITSIHEVFDWKYTDYMELRQHRNDMIEIDLKVEFTGERSILKCPKVRVKAHKTTKRVMNHMFVLDDGMVKRQFTLSDKEKETVKDYILENWDVILEKIINIK